MANRLAGLLRGAGGELSLFPSLGRWMQAAAAQIDGLTGPYIEVRRATTDQAVDFSAESDIVFNSVVEDGGITYDTATGVFTLSEAGLYELEFYGTWVNFGTPNTTAATAQWVSHPTNTPLETGIVTWGIAATSTQNMANQPVAKVLYRAAAGAQVKVKASSTGGGGTADLQRAGSFATVRRIA